MSQALATSCWWLQLVPFYTEVFWYYGYLIWFIFPLLLWASTRTSVSSINSLLKTSWPWPHPCLQWSGSLTGQTLTPGGESLSNPHHCLMPNMPRISWGVNWVIDNVAWRVWHFNGLVLCICYYQTCWFVNCYNNCLLIWIGDVVDSSTAMHAVWQWRLGLATQPSAGYPHGFTINKPIIV